MQYFGVLGLTMENDKWMNLLKCGASPDNVDRIRGITKLETRKRGGICVIESLPNVFEVTKQV